jgi:predicted nucleic acid-binding Zn ribbon protein
MSNCSFQLKGSGWYVTDYKKKDNWRGKETESKKSDTPKPSAPASKAEEKKP